MSFALPEGWTSELLNATDDYIVITTARDRFMATVDLKKRRFYAGLVINGKPVNAKKYRGRNWNAFLILDAVAWLQSLEDTTPRKAKP